MALADPVPIVGELERMQGVAEAPDAVEASRPEPVLLEDADAALGAVAALDLAAERGCALEAAAGDFGPNPASKSAGRSLEPWSWRSLVPLATTASDAPKP